MTEARWIVREADLTVKSLEIHPNNTAIWSRSFATREEAEASAAEIREFQAARQAFLASPEFAAQEAAKAEREAAEKAERAALRAAIPALRRRVQRAIRRAGGTLERSKGGSNYYRLPMGKTLRLSDHEVPMTEARRDAIANGGFSWGYSILSIELIPARGMCFRAGRALVQALRFAGER